MVFDPQNSRRHRSPARRSTAAMLLSLSAALPGLTLAADDPVPMPQAMWDEPSHQLVFVRDHLRVMDVFFPDGATSEFHQHRDPAVYVFVQPGRVADQRYGFPWVKIPEGVISRGQILVRTDYLEDNLHHRVRNIDTQPTQIFAVVNTDRKSATPSESDGIAQNGVIDNPWFRVRKLVVDAAGHSEVLRPEHDAILMQPDNGPSHILSDGRASDYKARGGAFSYHRAGTAFSIVNEADGGRSFVLIEVRD